MKWRERWHYIKQDKPGLIGLAVAILLILWAMLSRGG